MSNGLYFEAQIMGMSKYSVGTVQSTCTNTKYGNYACGQCYCMRPVCDECRRKGN